MDTKELQNDELLKSLKQEDWVWVTNNQKQTKESIEILKEGCLWVRSFQLQCDSIMIMANACGTEDAKVDFCFPLSDGKIDENLLNFRNYV